MIKQTKIFWFLTFLLVFLLFRGFLFFGHSDPLGYDTGLYAKYIDAAYEALPKFSFSAGLPDWPFGLYFATNFLRSIGFSHRQVLYGFYIFLHAGITVLLYTYIRRRFGREAGIAALFLFMISVPQLIFFWLFYYKNTFALFLMLCAMLLLLKRSSLALFFTVGVAITHPLTAFVFYMYLFFEWMVKKDIYYGCMVLFSILMSALFFAWIPSLFFRALSLIFSLSPNLRPLGTFVDLGQYLFLAVYYLPFALWGIWISRKDKEKLPFFYLLVVLFFMSFASPIIPNRIIPFFDIVVILYAAIGLQNLFQKGIVRAHKILFFAWAVFLLLFFIKGVSFLPPSLPQYEINQIKSMNTFPQGAVIIATHSYYAPWIYGFSGHKTVAPEMFGHDVWSREEWEVFWRTSDSRQRAALMEKISDRPIYVFVGSLFPYPDLSQDKFFIKVSDNIFTRR